MLDASSAFDTISWQRIKDQLLKRNVPLYLVKLCIKQLISNRISVCGTYFIYPKAGIKQGGVLSGIFFSACYDDLIDELKVLGSGIIIDLLTNIRFLLFILIYADDVILVSKSPYGLSKLIQATFKFAAKYNDLAFNASKSWILRLGTSNKRPVSVSRVPVSDCQDYLGVQIGKSADPQQAAASNLYTKANLLLRQNKLLHACSRRVKNVVINSYGSV